MVRYLRRRQKRGVPLHERDSGQAGDGEARLSFKLGFLLLGVFPTDIFTSKARQWMNDNSWVVNEIVLGLFIALTISDIAG